MKVSPFGEILPLAARMRGRPHGDRTPTVEKSALRRELRANHSDTKG
jgi:hypothetical protein